jgi:hypothetical protein
MRKLLLAAVTLLLLSSSASGQSYFLYIHLSSGEIVTVPIVSIQRIEFENLTEAEDVEEPQQVPTSFQLMQNYPNPFNPSTTIEYQVPAAAQVSVKIFNIDGQLVKELLDELQTEGLHQVTWDGTNQSNEHVASGIYIFTLQSGDVMLSKKMILLK